MPDELSVSTQGLSEDLTEANGQFDEVDRGTMTPEELTNLLTRVLSVQEPDYSSGEDLCGPEVHVESSAGQYGFYLSEGRLHENENQCVVTPFEAVMLAMGQRSASATAGQQGPAAAPGVAPQPAAPSPAPASPSVAWVLSRNTPRRPGSIAISAPTSSPGSTSDS